MISCAKCVAATSFAATYDATSYPSSTLASLSQPRAPRRQRMPFLLVFAVLAGAGAVIGGALAAPAIDPKNCLPQERPAAGPPEEALQPAIPEAIPEE